MRSPSPEGLERLAALERALSRCVLEAREDTTASLEGDDVDPLGLPERDRRQLESLGPKRLGTYRRLVRATLLDTFRAQLPMVAEHLGRHLGPWVDRFLVESPPRSPVLRDVAFEFARWAVPAWRRSNLLPPWLGALARYELLEFDCHTAARDESPLEAGGLAPDLPVAFASTCRFGRFDWRAPDLAGGASVLERASREANGIVFVRDDANAVLTRVFHGVEAEALVELLVRRRPFSEGVQAAFASEGMEVTREALGSIGRLFERLFDDGIVRGSIARASAQPPEDIWPISWRDLACDPASSEAPRFDWVESR